MQCHARTSAAQRAAAPRRPPFVAPCARPALPRRCAVRAAATRATQQRQRAAPAPPTQQQQRTPDALPQQQQELQEQLQQQQEQLQQQQQPRQPGLASQLSSALAPLRALVAKLGDAVDPRLRGLLLLNIMTLIMGTNWVVLKESNDVFEPVVFTSLRFTLAAAAFSPFLLQGLKSKAVRKAGLEIGTWTALGYLAQSWALFMTPASRASLLSTFTVIAVPCLAGLSGQRVKPLVWACGAAALVGTTLLEQGSAEPPNFGDVLSILSALFFAMQLFRSEKMSRSLPEGSAMPLLAITLSVVALSSCCSAAVIHWQDAAAALSNLGHTLSSAVLALGPGESPADAAHPLYELMWTSFCSTDLVLLIELMALQSVSSTEAALIYSLEPVSGAAMAYAFLGERWGPMGWAGAAVILAASIACQLGGALDEDQPGGGDKGSEAASS